MGKFSSHMLDISIWAPSQEKAELSAFNVVSFELLLGECLEISKWHFKVIYRQVNSENSFSGWRFNSFYLIPGNTPALCIYVNLLFVPGDDDWPHRWLEIMSNPELDEPTET